MRLVLAIVSAIALLSLVPRAVRVGLAGGNSGALSRGTMRSEAVLANASISMARGANWLRPKFLGYALREPPMLFWLSAASARVFGISRFAFRFPVLAIAALAAGLLFLWAAELGGWPAGALAVALLISNNLWHVLSGMALTDALSAAFGIAALYALFADPWLESKASFWGFSSAAAAAILTHGLAGIIPLAVLVFYSIGAPPRYRPRFTRVAAAIGLAVAAAVAWLLYQQATGGSWSPAAGLDPVTPAVLENAPAFYGMRLALTDPMLLAAALVAIPGFVQALRRRTASGVLLASWLAAAGIAIFCRPNRNIVHLLPLVPALALLASVYGPLAQRTSARALIAIAAALVLAKAATPAAPWGMSFSGAGNTPPLAAALQDYCERGRANELFVAGTDDDWYASVLPLSRLQYIEIGMGVRASTTPAGPIMRVSSAAELAEFVHAHPEGDFLVPAKYLTATDAAHIAMEVFPDHRFLLSRDAQRRPQPPAWTCRM